MYSYFILSLFHSSFNNIHVFLLIFINLPVTYMRYNVAHTAWMGEYALPIAHLNSSTYIFITTIK
jgi:hypothetical protein